MVPASPEEKAGLIGEISQHIFALRGRPVILDADVAAFFGAETARVNEYRGRNADRFTETYAFQLTDAEWTNLKSQNAISSSHGGRRSLPWAYTEHGFTMLSMGMKGERAAAIAHVVIDTFVQYRNGTLPGGEVLTGPDSPETRRSMLAAVHKQMQALLNMPLPTGAPVSSELENLTEKALGRVKAMLDKPKVEVDKLLREIARIDAETQRVYAEIQKTEAETARIWVDVYKGRLEVIAQLKEMALQLERDEVKAMLSNAFDAPKLPGPETPQT